MIRTILTAFLLLVSIPASAGFKEGVDAFKRADYAAALREFEPLAIAGDASAQTNLGLLYSKGIGVPQNDAEAVKWYRYAAEQGHAVAQNNLGALYINGLGGPKDPILGLAWLLLSAEGGYQAAATAATASMEDMTPKEVECARKFKEAWTEKLALKRQQNLRS